ncbi:MAG: DsbA family protein [Bryobacterales bacterium]|nr:DsbA family protein [Bryobacterales bacterium]
MVLPRLLLTMGLVVSLSGAGQAPARRAAAGKKAAAPAPAGSSAKSALNKATLESYVRHLFVWGPQVKVEVGDAAPSPVPGMLQVNVHASAGNATDDKLFYVSKDGRKIVLGTVFDVTQNPFKEDIDKLKAEFQPSFGTPGAPVVLVVFSDFQCSFCKEEAKMLRTNVLSTYPKQVRVYFKDLPLESIHPWARAAAIAGRCIFRQNPQAFWTYHDWIFEHQAEINTANLKSKVLEFANGKEIDTLQLTRCMDTRATEAEVNQNIADARALKVNSTPTLFINGRRLVGQQGWPAVRQIIDYEIEYQKTAKNAGEDCGCDVKLPSPFTD